MIKEYPYQAWVLTPSFAPKQVTVVEPDRWSNGWLPTESGKHYQASDIYATKALAIQGGWDRVATQEAALKKKVESLEKKKSVLTKNSK